MNQTHAATVPAYTPVELQHAIQSLVCAQDIEFSDRDPSCWTIFGGLRLGSIDVFRNEGIGIRHGFRATSHIREDRTDDFLLSMPRSALITLSQPGNTIQLKPGDVAFVSLAKPCAFQIAPGNSSEPFAMTHVRLSGPLLRHRLPQIDACCHRPIELRPGAGKIMQSMFDMALAEGDALSEIQAQHFAQMLIDAVANVARAAPELAFVDAALPSAQVKIREAAKRFIERNLSDPDLNVADVARHCCVSVRYLHKVFAASAHSVSDFIRDSRLRHCRAALQAQAFQHKSVTDIAMMWGFGDSSSFCRAYKARFGLVPSKDRQATADCSL